MTTVDNPPPTAADPAAPLPAPGPHRTSRWRRWRRPVVAALALLIAILVMVAIWYLRSRRPLSELPGLAEDRMPHYVFSLYGATHPLGVAVLPSGDRIYVTESDGDRVVRVYNRSGKEIGTLRPPPSSTGAAHIPVYVAINPATDDIYVSDRMAAAVHVYDAAGRYRRTFAPRGDLGAGWEPLGLAFDRDGRLYATDVRGGTHRVLVFGADGTLQRTLGLPNSLSFPNGVVVDGSGNIEVSDSNNGRVVVFDPAGKLLAAINRGVGDGDLGLPRGVTVDDKGRLYVVDTTNHAVRVYRVGDGTDPLPVYLGSFGQEGLLDGRFEYPNGIATDTRSRIYVTDRENNRVQVWSY
ncbi:MAG: hypothetical protein HYR62_11175 [Actinobacteria bacterium]|nr:hypothetical protein [Actinomycetota bacterium]MBI3686871.1 hypothetical protein [Actinomycetota bacterium]